MTALPSGFMVNNGNYANDLNNIFVPLKPCDHETFNLKYNDGDFSLHQWFFLYNTNTFKYKPNVTCIFLKIKLYKFTSI